MNFYSHAFLSFHFLRFVYFILIKSLPFSPFLYILTTAIQCFFVSFSYLIMSFTLDYFIFFIVLAHLSPSPSFSLYSYIILIYLISYFLRPDLLSLSCFPPTVISSLYTLLSYSSFNLQSNLFQPLPYFYYCIQYNHVGTPIPYKLLKLSNVQLGQY